MGEYPKGIFFLSYIKRGGGENLIIGILKGRWVHEIQLSGFKGCVFGSFHKFESWLLLFNKAYIGLAIREKFEIQLWK